MILPRADEKGINNQGGSLQLYGANYFTLTANGTIAVYGTEGGITQASYFPFTQNSKITASAIPGLAGALTAEKLAKIDFSQIDIVAISSENFAAGASVADGGKVVLTDYTLDMTGPSCYGFIATGGEDQTQMKLWYGRLWVTASPVGNTGFIYGAKSESGGDIILYRNYDDTITGSNCYGLSASGIDHESNASSITCFYSPFNVRASQTGYGVVAQEGGTIDLIGSSLQLSGNFNYGIIAEGLSTVTSETSWIILTPSKIGYGAQAKGGGIITLKDSPMELKGNECYGFIATGEASRERGSNITYENSSINIQAKQIGYGFFAQPGGSYLVDKAMMNLMAGSCYGLRSDGLSTGTCSGSTLSLHDFNQGYGASSYAGGTTTLLASRIQLHGKECYGIVATGKATEAKRSEVTYTRGYMDINSQESGYGAVAEDGGAAYLNESSATLITQSTFPQYGLKARTSGVITAQNFSMSLLGQGPLYGGYATEKGQMILTAESRSHEAIIMQPYPSSLTQKNHYQSADQDEAPFSCALYADTLGTIQATHMDLKSYVENGRGIQALGGSAISLTDGNIALNQKNNIGVFLASKSTVALSNVTITHPQAGADLGCKGIYSAPTSEGINTVNLTQTTFQGDFAQLLDVNASSLKVIAQKNSVLSNQPLLGNIHEGTLDVDVLDSKLIGDLQGKGDVIMTLRDQAVWSGKIKSASQLAMTLNLGPYSVWEATGDTFISVLNNQQGGIQIAPSSNAASTHITVQEYQGKPGDLILNTSLGFQNSASDQITIHHHTATAPTPVTIQNQGVSKGSVLSHTIPLIQVKKEASSLIDQKAFFLKDFIGGDGYNYVFQYNPNDPNWHMWNLELQSHSSNTSLYANLPGTALTYGLSAIDTLHERRGGNCFKPSQEYSSSYEVWSRVMHEKGDVTEHLEGAAVKAIPSHFTNQTVEIGSRLFHTLHEHLHQDELGAFAALGEAVCHIGDQDQLIGGKNKIKVGSFATYWTHYGPLGGYVDTVVQGNYYDMQAMNTTFITTTRALGFLASVEGGLPFTVGERFILEPQVQMVSQLIHFDSFLDGNGVVKLSGGKSVVTRMGVRAAKQWRFSQKELSLWTRLGGAHEFLGRSKATLDPGENSLLFSSKMTKSWTNLTCGLDVRLTPLCSLYGSGGYSTNFNASSSYDVQAGMKWSW
ncbi:MAG: autotransporter outer membrane beta-barrel domain-containing protein [Candidatus Rhabdochlamydia sp.]